MAKGARVGSFGFGFVGDAVRFGDRVPGVGGFECFFLCFFCFGGCVGY